MIKNIISLLVITGTILLWGVPARAVDVDETKWVTATAVRVEDIDETSPLLDNFNDNGITNRWGGETGCFTDAGETGSCSDSNDSASPYEGAFCLKLDYDVSASASYAGYFSKLESKNLSSYTTISFWVKGKAGGEYFKIELKNNSGDANRNHAAVYITDYLDGGVTTSWKKVTIPFHNFVNLDSWTSMKEFVITFENSQSITNGIANPAGTIYIDEISFGSTAVNIVRIDHYGDKLGTCALGGNMGDGPGEPPPVEHSFSSSAGSYHDSPYGLKLDYNVTTASYCFTYSIFGGGDDGNTKITHDFSEYNYISFWIKAESGTKNPEGIKVELHDFTGIGTGEPFYVISKSAVNRITTTWKKFKIPLSSFKDWSNVVLDRSRISEFVFTFENGNTVDKDGIVYVDEVQFEK